ncbi:tyrosine-type recombinase/integrase [Leptospira stimsonii]|uniref:Site-specific integrase n=1 Tax=Leptospira stimsonii TaxID=2202203 RepID=A0ABY2N3S8_9LEPT|nr:tyrosine-type recombinase/integrase [Leptospira stimsonii]TGK15492.1 site-specific integrase [Leptospira stimsonii]TGM16497.1 site-specific integrase [Leptospira stimsonii]
MTIEKENLDDLESGRILNDSDMECLREACRSNPLHYTWIRILFSFGLRPEELISIRAEDVDIENGILRIRGLNGLAERSLMIPGCLLKDFYGSLKGKSPDEFLFSGRKGKLHRRTIQKLLQKIESKTGIEITFPIIRRTIAVRMHKHGISIAYISFYLGYKTRRATYKLIGKSAKVERLKIFSIEEIIDIGA